MTRNEPVLVHQQQQNKGSWDWCSFVRNNCNSSFWHFH